MVSGYGFCRLSICLLTSVVRGSGLVWSGSVFYYRLAFLFCAIIVMLSIPNTCFLVYCFSFCILVSI